MIHIQTYWRVAGNIHFLKLTTLGWLSLSNIFVSFKQFFPISSNLSWTNSFMATVFPLKHSLYCIRFVFEAVAQRCSVKKVFLEISQNSQENTCARVSFLIKLRVLSLRFIILSNCFITLRSTRTVLTTLIRPIHQTTQS